MLATALALLLTAAPTPGARGLVTARGLVDDFQFARAIAVIGETLQEPGLDTATLIALCELEGIAYATQGSGPAAKESFARLLTLDPAHPIPNELPPKVRTLYFGARSVAQREPLELVADVPTRTAGLITSLSVTVKNSSLVPAVAVRFTVSIDEGAPTSTVVPLQSASQASLPVKGAQVKWSAALLGAHEAVLRQVEREEQAPLEEQPRPVAALVAPRPAAASADWVRPAGIAVGVAGLVGLGVGTAFAVQSSGDRARISGATTDANGVVVGLTQAEAARLDASARSSAAAANVLLIAGGVATAGGLLMFLLGPSEPASVSLSVGPTALMVSGRFE